MLDLLLLFFDFFTLLLSTFLSYKFNITTARSNKLRKALTKWYAMLLIKLPWQWALLNLTKSKTGNRGKQKVEVSQVISLTAAAISDWKQIALTQIKLNIGWTLWIYNWEYAEVIDAGHEKAGYGLSHQIDLILRSILCEKV